MARYELLPIWATVMQLAVALERSVTRLPRYHKYALGAELLGQFRHADVGRRWARLLRRFGWLHDVFIAPARALTKGLQPRWRLPRERAARSLRQQLRGFAERCPGHVLLAQVGNRWRIVESAPDSIAGGPSTRLGELTDANARRCTLRWRAEGRAYAVVRQDGHQRDGRRARVVAARWCPQPAASKESTQCF